MANEFEGQDMKPEFLITHITGSEDEIYLGWAMKARPGFPIPVETGEITITRTGDTYGIDTEHMGKEFVKQVFNHLVDGAIADTDGLLDGK